MTSSDNTDHPSAETLKQLSDELRELSRELAREAPLDEARIAALRQKIAQGEYTSDAQAISHKLLELERSLYPPPDDDSDTPRGS